MWDAGRRRPRWQMPNPPVRFAKGVEHARHRVIHLSREPTLHRASTTGWVGFHYNSSGSWKVWKYGTNGTDYRKIQNGGRGTDDFESEIQCQTKGRRSSISSLKARDCGRDCHRGRECLTKERRVSYCCCHRLNRCQGHRRLTDRVALTQGPLPPDCPKAWTELYS